MTNEQNEQELSLVDLVVIWLQGWRPAVISAAALMVLVAGLVQLLSERYESQMYVQLASLQIDSETKLMVPSQQVVSGLKVRHSLTDASKKRPLPRLESVSRNDEKEDSGVIKLVALGETPEEARGVLESVLKELRARHDPLVTEREESRKELISTLENYTLRVSSNDQLSSQVDLAEAFKQLSEAKRELQSIRNTHALRPPSLPEEPVSPKIKLILLAAFVLASGLALIIPFILDFVRQVKARVEQPE